jgi:Fe2+ transport system protein B
MSVTCPRVAFLMDALMHKLGLHGKSIVPFILGFGCNVPAIMSTRILEDKRERFISAACLPWSRVLRAWRSCLAWLHFI